MQTIQQRLMPFLRSLHSQGSREPLPQIPEYVGRRRRDQHWPPTWVAELNYMFVLDPGIDRDALSRYCRRFEIQVPEE